MSEEEKLVAAANALAREFYSMQGYHVSEGYKFYAARHPHEVTCWRMAVAAYEHISGTDIEDCLSQIEDE